MRTVQAYTIYSMYHRCSYSLCCIMYPQLWRTRPLLHNVSPQLWRTRALLLVDLAFKMCMAPSPPHLGGGEGPLGLLASRRPEDQVNTPSLFLDLYTTVLLGQRWACYTTECFRLTWLIFVAKWLYPALTTSWEIKVYPVPIRWDGCTALY